MSTLPRLCQKYVLCCSLPKFSRRHYSRRMADVSGRLLKVQNLQRFSSAAVGASASSSDSSLKVWDLYASVCLERKPVITKELTPMEEKYAKFLEEIELENSKLSDHEIRHKKDLVLQEKIKKGESDVKGSTQTAQDFEDACTKELMKFVPAKVGQITEADKAKDTKSLNRALESHLLLVVEQKLGKDFHWVCPQLKRIEGETLRQTAERTLQETCPDLKTKILGNAPWGFYKYKYPKGVKIQNQNGEVVTGAKVFFYKAQLLSGNIGGPVKSENIETKDFQWLTRSELEGKLLEDYHDSISQFLIDEN